MQVIIVDTRQKWMVKEDNLMACMSGCRFWKRCQSRYGHECKRLGGKKIPKLR